MNPCQETSWIDRVLDENRTLGRRLRALESGAHERPAREIERVRNRLVKGKQAKIRRRQREGPIGDDDATNDADDEGEDLGLTRGELSMEGQNARSTLQVHT